MGRDARALRRLGAFVASVVALNAPAPPLPAPEREPSAALGTPTNGALRAGVPLPPEGPDHRTWDPILKRSPNRDWRVWGTDRTVARLQRVLARFRAAHPEAPLVLVGDLSRPQGGVFDRRFGGLGHASHQNGLDVDVYYPRRDRVLARPYKPEQVDPVLAQGLVDAFLAERPRFVFTGPRLGLTGPPRVVQPLVHHDDHLHVRFRP